MDKAQKELLKSYYRTRDIAVVNHHDNYNGYEVTPYGIRNSMIDIEKLFKTEKIKAIISNIKNLDYLGGKDFIHDIHDIDIIARLLHDQPNIIEYLNERQIDGIKYHSLPDGYSMSALLVRHLKKLFPYFKDELIYRNGYARLTSKNGGFLFIDENGEILPIDGIKRPIHGGADLLESLMKDYDSLIKLKPHLYKLYPKNALAILAFAHPNVKNFIDRSSIDGDAINVVLSNYPEFIKNIDDTDLNKLDDEQKSNIINKYPELKPYFQ